jgi:hypothetical protein
MANVQEEVTSGTNGGYNPTTASRPLITTTIVLDREILKSFT